MTQASHSLQQRAYEHVRERIATGSYPPGSRLDYRLVGQEIGTSATPVREALRRLETEGLVELVPRLGAVVKRLDLEEMRDLYGLREAIEAYAITIACQQINEHQLAQMARLLDQMDQQVSQWLDTTSEPMQGEALSHFLEMDWAFHEAIVRTAHNNHLRRIVENCHMMSRIFHSEHAHHDRRHLEEAGRQHRAILDALRRRDEGEARQLIIQHVRGSLDWFLAGA